MPNERKGYIEVSKDLLASIFHLPAGCKVDETAISSNDDYISFILKWNPAVCVDMPEVEEGKVAHLQLGYEKTQSVRLADIKVVDDE